MLAVAALAQIRGDPLAFEENLDRARRQPHIDLTAGEAVGNGIIVKAGVDVIIDKALWMVRRLRPIRPRPNAIALGPGSKLIDMNPPYHYATLGLAEARWTVTVSM